MKNLYYLAGLPRAGSTLLGSILNLHPTIQVTPTSPIADLICLTETNIKKLNIQYTFDETLLLDNITIGIFEHAYNHIDKPTVFDKHRGWPRNHTLAQKYIKNKFLGIITYRPIPDIITSYLTLIQNDPNNFIDQHLRTDGKPLNTRNRADYLWRYYISDPYNSCIFGLEHNREYILPISYDELTNDTKTTLKKIETFFDIADLSLLQLDYIKNTCAEQKDEAWGLKDLHTIRPTIKKVSADPKITLGEELYNYYSKFNLKL